ncbi:MAG: trypsin-like peptidase domain-containing protein [Sporichthyaceae bacterium]
MNTIGKQLLFSTVRLVNNGVGVRSVGTGFLLDADPAPEKHAPILITNKHVVEGATTLEVHFVQKQRHADEPALGQPTVLHLSDVAGTWIGHPSAHVDVAAIALAPLLGNLPAPAFYRTLGLDLLPTPEVAENLDAIEDLTFVGYPNGSYDTANLTPIVRRAITATPVELAFGGRPVFLVDGSVFGGSSGSPVFILSDGIYREGPGRMVVGSRLLLVGIIAETMIRDGLHRLVVSTAQHVRIAQELNLGFAFNWRAIDETVDAVYAAHGAVRPSASVAPPPSP